MRVSSWLIARRAPAGARPHARPLRRRGDDDRPLARRDARPVCGELASAGNTVIVLVGDHGHLLGEHGWTGKIASMLHPELIRVPLVIVDPRAAPAGTRASYLAQTHDVGPTLLVAGRRDAARAAWTGSTCRRCCAGSGRASAQVRLRRLRQLALRPHRPTGPTCAANIGRGRRFYDLERDPSERRRHRRTAIPSAIEGSTARDVRRPVGVRPYITDAGAPPPRRQNRRRAQNSQAAHGRRSRGCDSAAPFCRWATASGRHEHPNVLVIVVDTLRADHVYGDRARTPNMDALIAHRACRSRAPSPRRCRPSRCATGSSAAAAAFPFRDWHDYRGLMASPGWVPLTDVGSTWTTALQRAGYWTGYVTDNPFLGFSDPYKPLRRSFDRFIARAAGRSAAPGRAWLDGAPRPLVASVDPRARDGRPPAPLPVNGGYSHDESQDIRRAGSSAPERLALREAASSGPSRSWWTRSARTSPGLRRAATSTSTATRIGVGPSPACCATGASGTGWSDGERTACSSACRRCMPPR